MAHEGLAPSFERHHEAGRKTGRRCRRHRFAARQPLHEPPHACPLVAHRTPVIGRGHPPRATQVAQRPTRSRRWSSTSKPLSSATRLSADVERSLELVRHREVDHRTARRADQVVVMSGERLGELVAGPLVGRDDATHDSRTLEHSQVAVGRALREVRASTQDLRDGERPVLDEHRDQRSPALGVALPIAAQSGRSDDVDVVRHGGRRYRRTVAHLSAHAITLAWPGWCRSIGGSSGVDDAARCRSTTTATSQHTNEIDTMKKLGGRLNIAESTSPSHTDAKPMPVPSAATMGGRAGAQQCRGTRA